MNEDIVKDVTQATSTFDLVKTLYRNDMGLPFEMTPGQNEIFDCIFKKRSPDGKKRIWIATVTQYGKSDVVSMAALTRVATYGEKWVIVAPSQAKSRIIIGYIIRHVFDNEFTRSRFKVKDGESVDKIRRERSKNRITFDCGDNKLGEIFILSAESRLKNSEDMGNSLMGFGSPNVIEDEAALISDESDAKTMRMVGGFTSFGTDFVVKIGNPFQRNHFLSAYQDPAYYKINIDWERAVKEGRLTAPFIEEMRKKPFFRTLYENKFPEADDIDSRGWTQLLSEDEVELATKYDETPEHAGEKRIGHDVARGGSNFSTWIMRSMNFMEVLIKANIPDLTNSAAQTMMLMTDRKIRAEDVFVDDIGVGGGEVDHLNYQQKKVRAINVGKEAMEYTRFANIRAEAYWRFREWVKRGGKLCKCHAEDWITLTKIKYKPDSKGRIRIMSKDEMRTVGLESPDVPDGGMLTFARQEHGDLEERKKLRAKKKRLKKHAYTFNMGGTY